MSDNGNGRVTWLLAVGAALMAVCLLLNLATWRKIKHVDEILTKINLEGTDHFRAWVKERGNGGK